MTMRSPLALLAFLLLVSTPCFAQEVSTDGGDLDLLFTLGGLSELRLNPYEGGVGIRWFFLDNMAVRPSVSVSYRKNTQEGRSEDYTDQIERRSSFGFDFIFERHISAGGRLSPYTGLGLRYRYSGEVGKPSVPKDPPLGTTLERTNWINTVGPMGILGFSWALKESIYLGAEYRLSYSYSSIEREDKRRGEPVLKSPKWTEKSLSVSSASLLVTIAL
jgi:hypothetical protein